MYGAHNRHLPRRQQACEGATLMAEEYISFDDVRKQTLAEMNLVEQIVNLARHVEDTVREANVIINSYIKGQFEVVKAKYERVNTLKNSSEEVKSKVIEYIVRVTPGLMNKDIYRTIVLALERIAQSADAAAYRARMLALRAKIMNEEVGNRILELLNLFMNQYANVVSSLRMLAVNPPGALKHVDEILKLEESIDGIYKEIGIQLYDSMQDDIPALMITKELVDILENCSDLAREVAENVRYLALHKV